MSEIFLNEQGIGALFKNPQGPLGRIIDRKGRQLETLMKFHASGRPGPNIRTGLNYQRIRYTGLDVRQGGIGGTVEAGAVRNRIRYPLLLEFGGIAPNGKPYQYPFMIPALRELLQTGLI